MSNADSKQYKEDQHQGWDNVANGWQKWWKITEAAGENINRRLIQLAEIKQGSTVLDIATGIGEPAITAANQVGNSGHVLAIDISSHDKHQVWCKIRTCYTPHETQKFWT